jgi:hypothetical protein
VAEVEVDIKTPHVVHQVVQVVVELLIVVILNLLVAQAVVEVEHIMELLHPWLVELTLAAEAAAEAEVAS